MHYQSRLFCANSSEFLASALVIVELEKGILPSFLANNALFNDTYFIYKIINLQAAAWDYWQLY